MADSGAYGGHRSLSAISAVIVECADVWLPQLTNWQGAGDNLTDAEIDTIQAITATLQYEVMTPHMTTEHDYEQIWQATYDDDVASIVIDGFGSTAYARYELKISGMHSDTTASYYDPLYIRLNNVSTITEYYTQLRLILQSGEYSLQYNNNKSGFYIQGACGSRQYDNRGAGSLNMTFFNPQGSDWQRMEYNGSLIGSISDYWANCNGAGIYRDTAPLSKIEIFPNYGTTFAVGGGGGTEPTALIASLYGIR